MYSIIIYVGFILAFSGIDNNILGEFKYESENINYRAAIYTIDIDFSKARVVAAEMNDVAFPNFSNATAYMYIIQNGKNKVIEILDPIQSGSMPVMVDNWDYNKMEKSFSIYFQHSKKFKTYLDTIEVEMETSIGSLKNLGCGNELNFTCDSVAFILASTNKASKVYVKDTIANLSSSKLFYPDIKYLPEKIVGVGSTSNTMYLEKILNGKAAVDSILNMFTFNEFTLLTENVNQPVSQETIKNLIERMNKME